MGQDIHFSAYGDDSLISQVLFITGKRGSGKSWTAAVLMEEFARLGLQFVCFDALGRSRTSGRTNARCCATQTYPWSDYQYD